MNRNLLRENVMSDFQFDPETLRRLSKLVVKASDYLHDFHVKQNFQVERADPVDVLECALDFWVNESRRRVTRFQEQVAEIKTELQLVIEKRRGCET